MSKTANRPYRATVILDTRDYKEPIETLSQKLQGILKNLGATILRVENLGRRDFIRVTERRHPGDFYVEIEFDGPGTLPAAFHEAVRLDRTVKRVLLATR